MQGLMIHAGARRIGRQDLPALSTPDATETHKPIPHHTLIEALIESLAYRQLAVVTDEYAVSQDGMRLFGVLALSLDHEGVRLALGIRNSHDKSFSLGITAGYRVFVCDNLAFHGEFMPVTKKHTKHVDVIDVVNGAVDKAQRHFQPMIAQVDAWRHHSLPDNSAKNLIYDAFVAGQLDVPTRLAASVHRHYFEPEYEEFNERTMWSLSNAFTSAFKVLQPIPQFRATAALGKFLAGPQ
jgi:hypothetical protein